MSAHAMMARDLNLPTGIFVDGGYRASAAGRSFATETPYTREAIAELPACDTADVDAAVASACAAFEAGHWSGLHPSERKAVLSDARDLDSMPRRRPMRSSGTGARTAPPTAASSRTRTSTTISSRRSPGRCPTGPRAIRLANATAYGLAATLYTADVSRAHRHARQLKAGTISVNTYSEGEISTPFGGFKASGFGGRDNGLAAHEQYTELKTIWIDLTG